MSETHIWHFYFQGRGLSKEAVALLSGFRGDAGLAREGVVSEAMAPGAGVWAREQLYSIISICARGGAMGFSPVPSGDLFFWDYTGGLHDDLAGQSYELFFSWLCRHAARDQFFGVETVLSAPRPTFLYAVDRKFVSVDFERGDLGKLAGPFGVEAVAEGLEASPPEGEVVAMGALPIPAHEATVRVVDWDAFVAALSEG